MLKIRFSRIGKKKQPYYRVTIAENTKDPWGDSLEILGSYDPRTKELKIKEERVKYWLSKGAKATPTVNNLLIEKKIIEGEKVKAANNYAGKKKEMKKK